MFRLGLRYAGTSGDRGLYANGPQAVGSASALRRPAGHDQRSTG